MMTNWQVIRWLPCDPGTATTCRYWWELEWKWWESINLNNCISINISINDWIWIWPFQPPLVRIDESIQEKKESASSWLFLALFTGIVQICKKSGTFDSDSRCTRGQRVQRVLLGHSKWFSYHCPCLGTQFHRYCEKQLGGIKMEFASSEENRWHKIILNRP